jgi:hypothetical protein
VKERAIAAFEARHGITLPDGYRRFLLEVGGDGDGPPSSGLVRLGQTDHFMTLEHRRNWSKLPRIAQDFPFTRTWCWEFEDYDSDEECEQKRSRVQNGTLYLGSNGGGIHWLLVVTGPERERIWQLTDVGVCPTKPKRDFLRWYEDWLDGNRDWFG